MPVKSIGHAHIVAGVRQVARLMRMTLDGVEPAAQAQTCHGATKVQNQGDLVVDRRWFRQEGPREWKQREA